MGGGIFALGLGVGHMGEGGMRLVYQSCSRSGLRVCDRPSCPFPAPAAALQLFCLLSWA